VPKVILSGPVDDPIIENHSGKQVIAAWVVFTRANKMVNENYRLFTHVANQLPDGGSERIDIFSAPKGKSTRPMDTARWFRLRLRPLFLPMASFVEKTRIISIRPWSVKFSPCGKFGKWPKQGIGKG
jgi:hypothetical protein